MSNNASLSAAKRRRGGGPPPSPLLSNPPGQGGGGGGNLPPGLPPNFRQLPPQVQQQMLRQMQQRGPPPSSQPHNQGIAPSPRINTPIQAHAPTPVHLNKQMSIPPNAMGGSIGGANGPYSVNSVIHNRATVEVSGLHIRDLPMTSTGLPCLPSGAPLPPNVLFKLHHDELLNQDATLNEYSNRLQMLTNRVDRIDKAGDGEGGAAMSTTDISYESIIEDSNFISKVVDNILTNTNLSDIINQIEPLQKENEALRVLLNSQQKTLNELSGLVMKLLTKGVPECTPSNAENSEYLTYDANNIADSMVEYNASDIVGADGADCVGGVYGADSIDGVDDVAASAAEGALDCNL